MLQSAGGNSPPQSWKMGQRPLTSVSTIHPLGILSAPLSFQAMMRLVDNCCLDKDVLLGVVAAVVDGEATAKLVEPEPGLAAADLMLNLQNV